MRLGNYSIPERYTERAGYDLTLGGLTAGREYEVQLFVNDSSITRIGTSPDPALTTIARDQGGEVSLRHNAVGADGAVGQTVVGRFTATGDTQVIQLVGGPGKGGTDQRSALLNAYQVREIVPTAIETAITLTSRKAAGRLVFTGTAQNLGSTPVVVRLPTGLGSGRIVSLEPGETRSVTVKTPLRSAPAKSIRVKVSAPDGTTREYTVRYAGSR